MLLFILSAASWAHGRREEAVCKDAKSSDQEDHGILNSWQKEDRLKVMAALEVLHRLAAGRSLSASHVDTAENEFRNTIARFLKRRTMGKTDG